RTYRCPELGQTPRRKCCRTWCAGRLAVSPTPKAETILAWNWAQLTSARSRPKPPLRTAQLSAPRSPYGISCHPPANDPCRLPLSTLSRCPHRLPFQCLAVPFTKFGRRLIGFLQKAKQ